MISNNPLHNSHVNTYGAVKPQKAVVWEKAERQEKAVSIFENSLMAKQG